MRVAAVVLSALAGAIFLTGGAGAKTAASPANAGCTPHVPSKLIPAWARAGFSDAKPRMPYVLGANGSIAAILFGQPLVAPHPTDHSNKILWVSRLPQKPLSDLRIRAQRLVGTHAVGAPVERRVIGGAGPSIINLPVAGCYSLTLRWSGHFDTLHLQYLPR